MAERKPQWPTTGDSTIATEATEFGAYADESSERGVIHASTISSINTIKAGFGSRIRREN